MENLRELLNIYFSDDRGEEKTNKGNEVYENTYESIFNTINKEEKYITNVFENILREKTDSIVTSEKGYERLIEKAFKGAEKIGDRNISAYYGYSGENMNISDNYTVGDYLSLGKNYFPSGSNASENSLSEEDILNLENRSINYKNTADEKLYSHIKTGDINETVLKEGESYGEKFENSLFDNSSGNETENKSFSENYFNYDYKTGGAEETVSGAGFSAFVPSEESFAESISNIFGNTGEGESINDILNNYYGNTEGSRSVTNNISPSFNFYGNTPSAEMDIDDIADKIGEMLAEAAAGCADGFYG